MYISKVHVKKGCLIKVDSEITWYAMSNSLDDLLKGEVFFSQELEGRFNFPISSFAFNSFHRL